MDATSAASRSTSRRCGERRGAAPTRARSRASPGHPVVSAVHMKAHGWVGLAIIGAAEVLLFAGEPTVAGWFTPIVWTGYVLFIDALAARFSGRSYLTTDRVEGVLVALASVAGWWLFELYNAPRFWRGGEDALGLWWRYHGLEPNPFLRRVVYGVLWELWNYWAGTRWSYSVPYLGGVKIFEMPVLGYLGFLPFALEAYAMYHWLRGLLDRSPQSPVLYSRPHRADNPVEGPFMKAFLVNAPGGP